MASPQKLLLIIEDDVLFYPRFVSRLIAHGNLEIAGLIIAKAALKHNRYANSLKKILHFRFREIVTLLFHYAGIYADILTGRRETLAGIAKANGIPCLRVTGNANTENVVAWVKDKKPEIIFSASPLILGKELLAIPRLSINMHFSLLPAYKGIMPIFHAMAHGEPTSGISLHEMTRKIDEGRVLYQRELPLDYSVPMFENYIRFFDAAPDCVVECLNAVRSGEIAVAPNGKPSYFGYPDAAAWEQFRARAVRFV